MEDSITGARSVSAQGLALIRRFEGFSATPYTCPAGKLTIGFGHVLRLGERAPESITREAAEALLAQDARISAFAVLRGLEEPLAQCQLDALASFVFNVGSGAYTRSTLRKIVSRGWHDEVPAQLLRWVYVNGKVSAGLMHRRQAEGALYLGEMEE